MIQSVCDPDARITDPRVRKKQVSPYRTDVAVSYSLRGACGTREVVMSDETARALLRGLVDLLIDDPERSVIRRLLSDYER